MIAVEYYFDKKNMVHEYDLVHKGKEIKLSFNNTTHKNQKTVVEATVEATLRLITTK